jgi:hypothetical protein
MDQDLTGVTNFNFHHMGIEDLNSVLCNCQLDSLSGNNGLAICYCHMWQSSPPISYDVWPVEVVTIGGPGNTV